MKKVLSIIMVVGLLILPLSLSFAYAEEDYTNKFFDCKGILDKTDDEIVKVWVYLDNGIEDKEAFNLEVEKELIEKIGYNEDDLPEPLSGPEDADKMQKIIDTRYEIMKSKLNDHYEEVIASLNIDSNSILDIQFSFDDYEYILVEETVGKIKEIAQSNDVLGFTIYVNAYTEQLISTEPQSTTIEQKSASNQITILGIVIAVCMSLIVVGAIITVIIIIKKEKVNK